MQDELAQLRRFPVGFSEALYEDDRWAVVRRSSADGRRHGLDARQLGGTAALGTNLYVTSAGPQLRPCEVPRASVVDFLATAQPLAPRQDGRSTGYAPVRGGWRGRLVAARWHLRDRPLWTAASVVGVLAALRLGRRRATRGGR